MSSETRKRGRRAASRGKLRRETSIDGVIVERPFAFSLPTDVEEGASRPDSVPSRGSSTPKGAGHVINGESVGDGCYISATVNSKRYYGVLFDQGALKAASELHFQGEAGSLELNRRMMALDRRRREEGLISNGGPDAKRQKPTHRTSLTPSKDDDRPVQKFRYVNPTEAKEASGPGYRVLLATYANVAAAAEDDPERMAQILCACQSGGNFVGNYYFQYEVVGSALTSKDDSKPASRGMRMSMGMETFLANTYLPSWYPLCNLECGQSKILSMLSMKKNNKGGIDWDPNGAPRTDGGQNASVKQGIIPMEPRSSFRIGIVGGGIAGLACALELLQSSRSEDKLDVEVVLFEARSRVGGRLNTDRETFRSSNGAGVPVDLGASWIHGISGNPLTSICRDAGIDFVTASEEVKMLGAGKREVDRRIDKRMGQLFDDVLDEAAAASWSKGEYNTNSRDQKAVRWYAGPEIRMTDVPPHRHSSDVSINHAIGETMKKKRRLGKLSDEECNLLQWYTKNTEYALGANIEDLSMKYWDTDERHAFEGDHVLLKQGYSAVAEYIAGRCKEHGERFQLMTDCPVDRIGYARNTTSHPYPNRDRSRAAVSLSDTCRVTSRDNRSFNFDFVVCALPLGVLKHSIQTKPGATDAATKVPAEEVASPQKHRLIFDPPLPMSKRDAIEHVGFGLLNKVFLQFPTAFWRRQGHRESIQGTPYLADGQNIFGNASGFNPHHYMFLDVGRSLFPSDNATDGPPAVLMTLISGSESAATECMSDEDLVGDVLATLRHLFSACIVPEPVKAKRTKWGSDEFSRGCYTFLPPGTNDEDYHILQCPINGNGESLVFSREIMRLFWAGEHTTSLHPSMAHGAYLSGIRSAKEVLSTITSSGTQTDMSDCPIPISIFRRKHPQAPLQCSMCHYTGSQKREGALMAFQRGARQVLVHSHCAEYSPEVGLTPDGVWSDVIKAVNRGKQINCTLCGRLGGTIGCVHDSCLRTFHFGCCEEAGWNFERDGKAFLCELHRRTDSNRYDRISPRFFQMKNPGRLASCALCHNEDSDERRGELLGFHWRQRYILVHSHCIRYTNVVDTVDGAEEEDEDETSFKNIFSAANRAKLCYWCQKNGATIQCSHSACSRHFHYSCAEDNGWKFYKHGKDFTCALHRGEKALNAEEKGAEKRDVCGHTLPNLRPLSSTHTPSNAPDTSRDALEPDEWDSSGTEADLIEDEISMDEKAVLRPFDQDPHQSNNAIGRLYGTPNSARILRASSSAPWKLPLCVDRECTTGTTTLRVAHIKGKACHPSFEPGDIILGLNGLKVGSKTLKNFTQVLMLLRELQEKDSTELNVEFLRCRKPTMQRGKC